MTTLLALLALSTPPDAYPDTATVTRAAGIVVGAGASAYDAMLFGLASVDDPQIRLELEINLAVVTAEVVRAAAISGAYQKPTMDRLILACSVYDALPFRVRHAVPLGEGAALCEGVDPPETVSLFKNAYTWKEVTSWL